MARLPWEKFWYDDWKADPGLARCSLAARGLWIDALCFLWHEGGHKYSAEPAEWTRICRCSEAEFAQVMDEFRRYKVCDVSESNGRVTLSCRRLERESNRREYGRLRSRRHREKTPRNADITPDVTPPVTPYAHARPEARGQRPEAKKPRSPEANTPQPPKGASEPGVAGEFVERWNEMAAKTNKLSQVKRLGPKREKMLKARLRDGAWASDYAEALKKIPDSPFLLGGSDSGWRANAEWFLRAGSAEKLLEGTYDRKSKPSDLDQIDFGRKVAPR